MLRFVALLTAQLVVDPIVAVHGRLLVTGHGKGYGKGHGKGPYGATPICTTPVCGKPTWNGKPGEACSKTCKAGAASKAGGATCGAPGCGKPTWNGQPGEFCSKTCKAGAASKAGAATCITPGCGKPTYNGKPGEKCSKSCVGPTCITPGCGKPTWNGKPGEKCSKSCKAVPPSKPAPITDPRKSWTTVDVVGFYHPDKDELVDQACGFPQGGNFYRDDVWVASNSGGSFNDWTKFKNAEAAFQALKFWKSKDQFKNLDTGNDAFKLKRRLAGNEDWRFSGHGSNWSGMLHVVTQKFSHHYPAMNAALLATGDAFLVEHNSVYDRDQVWSDNWNGSGTNWLGIQLMMVRDTLTGNYEWTNWLKKQLDLTTGKPLYAGSDKALRAAVYEAVTAFKNANCQGSGKA